MTTSIIIGNPKPGSRTARAASMLAEALTYSAPENVIEVSEFGPALLGDKTSAIEAAVSAVAEARLVIVASPTYKATFTGLLKLFLEQFAGGTGLQGVVAIPLMLGATAEHGLAAEYLLKPLLTELGATCPAPGLFLMDKAFEDGLAIESYAKRWGPVVRACCSVHTSAVPAMVDLPTHEASRSVRSPCPEVTP